MNALLSCICDYMGYKGEWDHLKDRPSDVRKLCANIDRARECLGFEPEMDFENGIKETLDWYMNNSII